MPFHIDGGTPGNGSGKISRINRDREPGVFEDLFKEGLGMKVRRGKRFRKRLADTAATRRSSR